MAEQFSGRLASATFLKKNDKGWSNYDLVFDDGSIYKDVGIAPDKKTRPEAGQTVTLFKTRYSWMIGDNEAPANSTSEGTSKGSPNGATGGSSYKQTRDEWNDYQIKERDPKIERQTYIRMALDFYAACIPFMEKQPKDSREIDSLFNDAVAKGDAEYQRASK